MGEWKLELRDLKNYPHFDSVISTADAEKIATDPDQVARHKFYPFMLYNVHWTRYAERGALGDPKNRPIRYAARRDAYIFSYYRHLLSVPYEAALKELGLASSVLAYRRILSAPEGGGKCNIHFAQDAFLRVQQVGDCCVIALDISAFFESLDHDRLKAMWARMLGKTKLPADHFRVFEAMTRYAVVDKQKVYERLGHYGPKRLNRYGKPICGYLTPYKKIPKQLCTGHIFQSKIAGYAKNKSIIKTHYKTFGIPQGAPISDLLANLYLLDFDVAVLAMANELGGTYYRYSDDILLIIPGDKAQGLLIEEKVRTLMPTFGKELIIKEKKSSVWAYKSTTDGQTFSLIKGEKGVTGLEYLGFRYDGKKAFIRNSTIQNLYRKVTYSARREANALAKRYPNKSALQIEALCDYEAFIKQFGRVEEFYEEQEKYTTWTFWTYANRASKVFGALGSPIKRQLKKHREILKSKLQEEIARAVTRRNARTP